MAGFASVQRKAGRGDLPSVVLSHANGDTCTVYDFGATVTNYVHAGKEVLFCGDKALFNGKKAVRGGVPVVFPQFGQPDPAMAQHGFLRNNNWEVNADKTGVQVDGSAQVVFVMRHSAETQKVWPHEFVAEYTVLLKGDSLITSLKTSNLDKAGEVDPMLLLHTYYAVADITTAQVSSLKGVKYLDKAPGEGEGAEGVQAGDAVVFARKCDKVFLTGSGVKDSNQAALNVTLSSAPGADLVGIALTAAYHQKTGEGQEVVKAVTPDVVVWNPWIDMAKDFADMNDEDYKIMVCVEPGLLGENRPKVQAGDSIELTQFIQPKW